jgi:hypothetical protein
MHYAEGSLMNWLVMKLVFVTIPTQPMPFFVRPIARALCEQGAEKAHRPQCGAPPWTSWRATWRSHRWFAGEQLSMADFQMSFAVEAALSRAAKASHCPHLLAYRERMQARPAYQRPCQGRAGGDGGLKAGPAGTGDAAGAAPDAAAGGAATISSALAEGKILEKILAKKPMGYYLL